MLVPAIMLILIALGSIAVDMTAVFGAQRATQQVVAAAADDAAGMLDSRAIQRDGTIAIDPIAAERVAVAHIEASSLPGTQVGSTVVRVAPDGQSVFVQVTVRVPHVTMNAVPGAEDDELLLVNSTGRLLP